jgi:hypothetical protein
MARDVGVTWNGATWADFVMTPSASNVYLDLVWLDQAPPATNTLHAAMRNGYNGAGSTVRVRNGSWATDATMVANDMPHLIDVAPDGTVWMGIHYTNSSYDKLWKKEVGGSWTFVANHTFLGFEHLQAVSATECWVSGGHYVARWAGSWTNTWTIRIEIGVVSYTDTVFHYISPTHVIAAGHDGVTTRIAKYDGASWTQISNYVGGANYCSAIHVNGSDLWVAESYNVCRVWHHSALGVGAGWTNISTAGGWPTGAAKDVSGIYGTATDLWVSLALTTSEVDVLRTLDNGATAWTGYTRNAGNGCVGIIGDGAGKIYVAHVATADISEWNGSSWSTEAVGGLGSFRSWSLPAQWAKGYQKLTAQPLLNEITRRSDETVTAVATLLAETAVPQPGVVVGVGLPDETETPALLGPSTSERWTSPIQTAGDLTQEPSGGLPDETETPEVVGGSRQERWTTPLQEAGALAQEPSGGLPDATETPALLGPSQQERWTTPLQKAGAIDQGAGGGLPDGVEATLSAVPDYMEGVLDGDGNELLGGTNLTHVIQVDTTTGGFGGPVAGNHWGAARDGKFYANGAECGPGDFGTVAGGMRHTAWSFSGQDPMGQPLYGAVSLPSDNVIQFSGYKPSWNGDSISSLRRWYLTGDFDIEVEYLNWAPVSGENVIYLSVCRNIGGTEGTNLFYCYRHTNGNYYSARVINNGWANLGNVGTSDTAGKFRITRSSGVLQSYYWTGSWTPLGATYSHANLNSDLYVDIHQQSNNASCSVQVTNFVINSGTTTNRAGWYREASGTERGTQADMPDSLGIVCTNDTLDLVDIDNDKLWMRFLKGANLALHNVSPWRPRRVR